MYIHKRNDHYVKMEQLVVTLAVMQSMTRNCNKIMSVDMFCLIYQYRP